jgi:hypothetical membrane protein
MTRQTTPATTPFAQAAGCGPADRVTKSLLGYGIIVGPVYVVVSLAQALTRAGFDVTRHEWSLLANGEHGWIQSANLVLSGLMVIAFSIGLRRALTPGPGSRWAARLVAGYGTGSLAAGSFRADPALGFPIGTPPGQAPISWHGLLHFVCGGIGFICLPVGCFVMARRYAVEGRRRWAGFCRSTGVVFLTGFAMVASIAGSRVATLAFTAAVLLVWGWMSAVATDRYRRVTAAPGGSSTSQF